MMGVDCQETEIYDDPNEVRKMEKIIPKNYLTGVMSEQKNQEQWEWFKKNRQNAKVSWGQIHLCFNFVSFSKRK